MKVLFDTGSAGMYLITDDCKSTSCDSNLIKKYDTKSSVYFRKEKNQQFHQVDNLVWNRKYSGHVWMRLISQDSKFKNESVS